MELLKFLQDDNGVSLLGNSPPNYMESSEATRVDSDGLQLILGRIFNNYSYVFNITIKGQARWPTMSIASQTHFLNKLINEIIQKYCINYFITFEYHACGEWLHLHGIGNFASHKKFILCRQDLWKAITGRNKLPSTYKPCLSNNRVCVVATWLKYICKDINYMIEISCIYPRYNLDNNKNLNIHNSIKKIVFV